MSQIWRLEPEFLDALVAAVPEILSSQKPNGQFGTEPWICRDQQHILPLAVAWSLEQSPYYNNPDILQSIIRGGDALIDAQDENGMWTFRKKDHSTWGQILMPWTYSRWIRAYRLIRDVVDSGVRDRWDAALTLGFEAIAGQELKRVHNIPAHHAMALYCAGMVFDREDWRTQARSFMHQVTAAQSPHGWWTEHMGPVVSYNFVYVDALGVYYALSDDEAVLDALERAARFHASYTYPDGSIVETVDERNPYHAGIHPGNPGFSYTAAGRGYLAQQHALVLKEGGTFDADYAAIMLLASGEGPVEETAAAQERFHYRMGNDAQIVRRRPWFISLSAYVCEPEDTRWRQDRQNFVSVFHDRIGLILGGGNTKLQPLWSTCTVGDRSLLFHTPGDEDPDFGPHAGLMHVPDMAVLQGGEEAPGLTLHYGNERFTVTLLPRTGTKLHLTCKATAHTGLPVESHLTLMPYFDELLRLSTGVSMMLTEGSMDYTMDKGDGWVEHAGWRLTLPQGTRVIWPVLPHNPYRKAGDTTIDEGRIVVALPFSAAVPQYELVLTII